jgi:hypothetical protein
LGYKLPKKISLMGTIPSQVSVCKAFFMLWFMD